MANRKQRKDAYIREKNYLREGGIGVFEIDVCRELIEDKDFVKYLINFELKKLIVRFKITLVTELIMRYDGHSRDLYKTIRVTFKKA